MATKKNSTTELSDENLDRKKPAEYISLTTNVSAKICCHKCGAENTINITTKEAVNQLIIVRDIYTESCPK